MVYRNDALYFIYFMIHGIEGQRNGELALKFGLNSIPFGIAYSPIMKSNFFLPPFLSTKLC